MGLFDLIKNFDPDAIVKGINDLEQAIGNALDSVDGVAEKVENTAKVVEEKALQSGGTDATDDSSATTHDNN